jgi:hypothetical protein
MSNIRYYEIGKYQREFLQAISMIEDWNSCIITSAVYSQPKHYKKGTLYNLL